MPGYGTPMATPETPRRPARLRPGSKVAVVGPSSGLLEPSVLERGLHALRSLGLEVSVAPGVGEIRGYLAGDDRRRAEDLLRALADPSVDAVWCSRGGYGAQRTVAALDPAGLDAVAAGEPKVFVGFSDVTVLHALMSRRLGWVSFYGPTVASLRRASDYTIAGVRRALFDAEAFAVPADPDDAWVSTLVGGRAEGPLAGGCLTLLATLAGTALQVDFAGKVAFFEDTHETAERVDRYLSQLLAAGCFDGCLGVVIGDHTDTSAKGGSSLGVEQVFADLIAPLGVPSCFYLPIGHGAHQATLPIGVRARVDADAGTLEILEAGVR
jgi:muramoyltetrapeptide carboxypeptidase